MDSEDTQPSVRLLKLLDQISSFVRAYFQDGEKVLLNCDSHPSFQAMKEALELLELEDIGITKKTLGLFFQPQKICGIKVLEEPYASISVFCMSKGMFLTFHDHPHMTVLSKVIHGELERYAVEPVKEEPKKIVKKKTSNNKNNHLPEKKPVICNIIHRDVIKSPMILRLSPTIENIHSFRARTDCILFDILVPNYDNSYRMCHFYKEISSTIAPILHPSKKFKQENDETGEDSLGIKGFIEGTILLEEIPEPLELQSFVVIAFPRLLTLKL